MTNHIKAALSSLAFCATFVLMTAFVRLGFDPWAWTQRGRAIWIIIFVSGAIYFYVTNLQWRCKNDQA